MPKIDDRPLHDSAYLAESHGMDLVMQEEEQRKQKVDPPSPIIHYIGIDPGVNGGLAMIGDYLHDYLPMPETKRDIWNWFSQRAGGAVAVIEKVATSPQMGVVSAGTFMGSYHALLMAMVAAHIPFEEIRPQVWQKALLIPPKKKSEDQRKFKLRLLVRAQQEFPDLPIWNEPKSKGKQLAICDAMLISLFCERKHRGLL